MCKAQNAIRCENRCQVHICTRGFFHRRTDALTLFVPAPRADFRFANIAPVKSAAAASWPGAAVN